jgi:phosphatidylglycerophosphatase A
VRRLAVLVATVFGAGRLPVVPATWASLLTAIVLYALRGSLAPVPLLVAAAVVTAIGIPASGEAERSLGHDAKPIVIDEVAGMLVSALGLRHLPGPRGAAEFLLLFGLFRVFDIVKPWPVLQSQALPGGWGVVVDDLLAGIYTAMVLWLASGLLGRL